MKRSILREGFSLFCAAALLAVTNASADDWYRWRGPDQNGISKETGWLTKWPDEGPKKLWKTSVGIGFSCMSIRHGHLYTMGHDGNKTETIYCIDVTTGKPVWTKSYPAALDPNMYEGGPNSTPTVDGDRVYTLSKKGEIFCLDAAKGTVIWSKNAATDLSEEIPTWGFASSALIEGDLVIFDLGSAGVALNKNSGDVVWLSGTSTPGYSTPLLSEFKGEKIAVINAAKGVEAVKVADGKSVWSFPWKTEYDMNIADPILSGGKMFVSSDYNRGCALADVSSAAPREIWENKNLRTHIASSVLWQGCIYGVDDISSGSSALKCLSWDTGDVKWIERRLGKGTLMVADGKIIALSDKGELMVIDPSPDSCKIISSAQVLGGKCWTAPVLSNGRIFCRNAKGDLVCLDVSSKKDVTAP